MQSLQKAWKRNIKNMFFRCSLFQSDNHWVTHSLQWNKVISISGGVNVNRKSDINWKLSSLQPVRSDLTPQNSLINLSVWLLYLKPICFLISSSTIGKPSFLTFFYSIPVIRAQDRNWPLPSFLLPWAFLQGTPGCWRPDHRQTAPGSRSYNGDMSFILLTTLKVTWNPSLSSLPSRLMWPASISTSSSTLYGILIYYLSLVYVWN